MAKNECCMCGDHGLSSELFACQNCRFRTQHKYCSNLYPGAESYNTCNWCLTKSSKVSHKKISTLHQQYDGAMKMIKKKRDVGEKSTMIPAAAGRERRTRSEEMEVSNSGKRIVVKKVFRNKVRRYKLLDEVSS